MAFGQSTAEKPTVELHTPASSVHNADSASRSMATLAQSDAVDITGKEKHNGSSSDLERGADASSSSAAANGPEEVTERKITGWRWVLVCVALYITALLYGIDNTIAADVQASVVDEFGAVEQLTWLGTGFPMGSVAHILLIGALYGKFDQKWVYFMSIVFFEAGSALCGAAPNMNALIVGRVIAGIGGCGVYLGALNYMTCTTTPTERGAYIAGIGLVWGTGCILGPVIGGAFAVKVTWRWAFYINLPVAGIFAPVYLFYLPSINLEPQTPWYKKALRIDWIGYVLSAAMWVSFTLVLTFAGGVWGWNDGRTIATFIVFGALLAIWIVQQVYLVGTTFENRLMPLHLLRDYTQVLLYIATSANVTVFFLPVYYLPLYFQFVANDTALMAAVRLLPFIIFFVVVNMASGWILPRMPWYSIIYLAGGVILTISGACYFTISADMPIANIYGFSVLGGIGAGLGCQTGYAIAALRAPGGAANAIHAISLQNVSQVGSSVIALVISGQIFQSISFRNLSKVLDGHGFSDAEIHGAVAGAQSAVFEQLQGPLREQAVEAITLAIKQVFSLLIVGGAIVLLTGIFMKREKLMS